MGGSQLVKDETLISCTQSQLGQYVTVPSSHEVSFINKYSLIATKYCKAPDAGSHSGQNPTIDSHHTTESNVLKNLCLKTPIAWGNSADER